MRIALRLLLLSIWLGLWSANATAAYPERVVKIVIPFPAGGVNDVVARIVAQALSAHWNRSVIVENRPGASAIIGAQVVATSPPDGYTLLNAPSVLSSHPALYPKAGYDLKKDLVPVAQFATFPVLILSDPSLHLDTAQKLLDYVRNSPVPINYAAPGSSSTPNMAAEWLKYKAGNLDKLAQVPFKGDSDSITAVMAGTIPIAFVGLPSGLPHIGGGRVAPVAVSTLTRADKLPAVPTVSESGVPGYEIAGWSALMAPTGTPPAIIKEISDSVQTVLKDPAVVSKITELGALVTARNAEQFKVFLNDEIDKMTTIVQAAKIQPN